MFSVLFDTVTERSMKENCHDQETPQGPRQRQCRENAMRSNSPQQWSSYSGVTCRTGNQFRNLIKAPQVLIESVDGNDERQGDHRNGQGCYRVESRIEKESAKTVVRPQRRDEFE